MPLEHHLVVHLQEMYATEKEYQRFIRDWSGDIQDQQLKQAMTSEVDGINQQLDNLAQCLSAFGEMPPSEMPSPTVQALRQEDQATKQMMRDATPIDWDVHVAMADIGMGHLEIGKYQGMLDMAKALDQRDVANLLRQNLDAEQGDLRKMQQLLPDLINLSKQQRKAA